jgi:hypothetical protein
MGGSCRALPEAIQPNGLEVSSRKPSQAWEDVGEPAIGASTPGPLIKSTTTSSGDAPEPFGPYFYP